MLVKVNNKIWTIIWNDPYLGLTWKSVEPIMASVNCHLSIVFVFNSLCCVLFHCSFSQAIIVIFRDTFKPTKNLALFCVCMLISKTVSLAKLEHCKFSIINGSTLGSVHKKLCTLVIFWSLLNIASKDKVKMKWQFRFKLRLKIQPDKFA